MAQYRDVLTSPDFRHSLLVTGQFALYTVIGSTAHRAVSGAARASAAAGIVLFRTVYSSTVASSVAVSSVMWLLLLNPTAAC